MRSGYLNLDDVLKLRYEGIISNKSGSLAFKAQQRYGEKADKDQVTDWKLIMFGIDFQMNDPSSNRIDKALAYYFSLL